MAEREREEREEFFLLFCCLVLLVKPMFCNWGELWLQAMVLGIYLREGEEKEELCLLSFVLWEETMREREREREREMKKKVI